MKKMKQIQMILAMLLFQCPGIMRVGGAGSSGLPRFTYTGTYTLIDDGNRNWRIKFLSSGTLTLEANATIDVFCVGGGGGGINVSDNYWPGCGGGGYTGTYTSVVLQAGVSYSVVVGSGGAINSDGGITWFLNSGAYYANGGRHALQIPGYTDGTAGGAGGSGGGGTSGGANGGVDGASGQAYTYAGHWAYGGAGQGTTTREFGESTGTLYASGGGLSTAVNNNTGNGANNWYDAGCSGICVIRNHRAA